MIEVRIPNEIKKYKETYYFGLDFRKLVCLVFAIVVNVPLYVFLRDKVNEVALSYTLLIETILIMGIGFFKYNNMTFEKFLWVWLKFQTTPQLRLYKTYTFHEFAELQRLKDKKRRKK